MIPLDDLGEGKKGRMQDYGLVARAGVFALALVIELGRVLGDALVALERGGNVQW